MFQTKAVEKNHNTHLYSIICFRKSCCLWEKEEKYCRTGQATDDMTHVQAMLDN